MEDKQRELRECEFCKTPSISEFKKVAGLRNSGLLIFLHKGKQSTVLPSLDRRSIKPKDEDTFILHNAGDKELKRSDYIIEMCQYRTKCFQCKTVVQRVRSLLDEITDIKRNEVLGVCEHCKRANPSGKCRRCEYIVNKFLCNKVKLYEERQNRFKSWLCKVNQFLHTILESERVCKHTLYKESSALELEKLLEELKSPIEMRQPDITFFPTESGPFSSMIQSKDMLEELLIKLKSESFRERSSNDSLFVSPSRAATSCVCKYFMDKHFEERPSTEIQPRRETLTLVEKLDSKTRNNVSRASVEITATNVDKVLSKDKKNMNTPTKEKAVAKSYNEKTPEKENVSPDRRPKTPKEKSPKEGKTLTPKEKTSKEAKIRKPKLSPEEEMMMKMMKDRQKEKEKKEKSIKQEKVKYFAKIESLPQLKQRQVFEVVEKKSESVVECGHEDTHPTEMIKGTKLVRFNTDYKKKAPESNMPLLYKIDAVFPEPETLEPSIVSTTTTTTTMDKEKKTKSKPQSNHDHEEVSTKGVIKYELSNRDFIEKGWTILPTTKFMRRMNIYKMEPANPKYDWFKRHKYQKMMFYDSSEKLAEIDDNGRGKWFYKNGMVALDYYNAQELNAGQRYVVYSSGEKTENGKTKPVTVLASFDFLGNGVVYDHYGNVRLKYNQTEGIVFDEKIGPPGRWKWHSLNEPPILQPVYIDSYVKHRDPCMKELLKNQKDDKSETSSRRTPDLDADMLAIEFENFVKAKADKLLQKFKPFQIRMKALKLNDQFSLRILDQAKIYLLFRDGQVSLKLNLGMLLNSTEIIDTEATEVSKVATPYDRIPPKSSSVAEIQHTLNNAKKIGKSRTKNVISVKKANASRSSI